MIAVAGGNGSEETPCVGGGGAAPATLRIMRSMVPPQKSILSSADVCQLMGGISSSTLHDWSGSDVSLAGCIMRSTRRSTLWSRQRLIDRGFLMREVS